MRKLFPFNYFYAQLGPKKMFAGRHELSWFQMLFVLVFLIALDLLAVPFYFQQQQTIELKNYLPQVAQLLENEQLQSVAHQTPFKDLTYAFPQKTVIFEDKKTLIALDKDLATAKKYQAAVILGRKNFVLHEKGLTYQLFYQAKFSPAKGDLKDQLTKTWYQQNKAALTFSMMALLATILLVTDLIFILGGAFFLWLTRNSSLTDISSFKEATNLMLNILGPASLLAALGSFIAFDLANIVLLQTFALALLFLYVYATTRFKDPA